jgi:hypothetical protein
MEPMAKEDSDFIVDVPSVLRKTVNHRWLDEGIPQGGVVCLGSCPLPWSSPPWSCMGGESQGPVEA